nr:hypothetical protein [Providencia sp. JUb39]
MKQTSSQLTLKTKDASPKQPQFVHLSQCDVEAVDVAFRTTLKGEHEHWGGLNVPTPDGKAPIPTNQWHYRVSPADASTASSMVLQQGADLVADTPLAGDKTPRRYFRLDGTRYAYTVAPEGGHTEAVMAFWVSLHHGEPGMMESAELLEGGFSVELTYR